MGATGKKEERMIEGTTGAKLYVDLGYLEIVNRIAKKFNAEDSYEQFVKTRPSFVAREVRYMQMQVQEYALRSQIARGSSASYIGSIKVALAQIEKRPLHIDEIGKIARVLYGVAKYYKWLADTQMAINATANRQVLQLDNNIYIKKLHEQISKYMDSEGEIRRQNIPDLMMLDRQRATLYGRRQEIARNFISKNATICASQTPTVRDGRVVVAIGASFKNTVEGIVHGSSASAQTVFIEIKNLYEANNEIEELDIEEEKIVYAICTELTEHVKNAKRSLKKVYAQMIDFDIVKASWEYQQSYEKWYGARHLGIFPEWGNVGSETDTLETGFNDVDSDAAEDADLSDTDADAGTGIGDEHAIYLPSAIHPLIAHCFPIDIDFRKGTRQLVLTGPNAGGKTVALKTLGLLVLLNQSAIPIPVGEGAVLPIFSHIYVAIGDLQDISKGESTFSAHLGALNTIIRDLVAIKKYEDAHDTPQNLQRAEKRNNLAKASQSHSSQQQHFSEDMPTTNVPATNAPTTNAPTTNAPTTNVPATNAPATNAPATNAPATHQQSTHRPAKLLLIDELCSGTDEQEGGALAWAVLEFLLAIPNVFCVTTTHSVLLKQYAMDTAGVIVAALEHGSPSDYRIVYGSAGASEAALLAKKLGLDRAILLRQEWVLQTYGNNTHALLETLHNLQRDAHTQQARTSKLLAHAESQTRELSSWERDLKEKEARIKSRKYGEADGLLKEMRATLQGLAEQKRKLEQHKDATVASGVGEAWDDKEQKAGLHSPHTQDEEQDIASHDATSQLEKFADKIETAQSEIDREISEIGATLLPICLGDEVRMAESGIKGHVIKILDADKYMLRAGLVTLTVARTEIKKCEEIYDGRYSSKTNDERFRIETIGAGRANYMLDMDGSDVAGTGASRLGSGVSGAGSMGGKLSLVLDVRGTQATDAVEEIMRQIDKVALANVHSFAVIHGKGYGVLAKEIRSMLQEHSLVSSYEYALPEDGGQGKTIVNLH